MSQFSFLQTDFEQLKKRNSKYFFNFKIEFDFLLIKKNSNILICNNLYLKPYYLVSRQELFILGNIFLAFSHI